MKEYVCVDPFDYGNTQYRHGDVVPDEVAKLFPGYCVRRNVAPDHASTP